MTIGLEPLHGVVHDREQQVFLALDVVVEPGLGQVDRGGDRAHRGGVEALLVKDLGGLGVDVDRAVASRRRWRASWWSSSASSLAGQGGGRGNGRKTRGQTGPDRILPTVRLVNPMAHDPSSPGGLI